MFGGLGDTAPVLLQEGFHASDGTLYNIVGYGTAYYGLPQSLGAQSADVFASGAEAGKPGVVVGTSTADVQARLTASPINTSPIVITRTSTDPLPGGWGPWTYPGTGTPTHAPAPMPNHLLPAIPATPPPNALTSPVTPALVTTAPTGTIFGMSPLILGVVAVGAFLLLRKR